VEYLLDSFTDVPSTSVYILQISRMSRVSSDYVLRDQKECEVRRECRWRDSKTSYENPRFFSSFTKFIRRFRECTLHDETP